MITCTLQSRNSRHESLSNLSKATHPVSVGAGETAQWLRALATKSEDMSSTPGPPIQEGENQLLLDFCCPLISTLML